MAVLLSAKSPPALHISDLVGLLDLPQFPLPALVLRLADDAQAVLQVGDTFVAEYVFSVDLVDGGATHGCKELIFG
jgi:hypothetical protein